MLSDIHTVTINRSYSYFLRKLKVQNNCITTTFFTVLSLGLIYPIFLIYIIHLVLVLVRHDF